MDKLKRHGWWIMTLFGWLLLVTGVMTVAYLRAIHVDLQEDPFALALQNRVIPLISVLLFSIGSVAGSRRFMKTAISVTACSVAAIIVQVLIGAWVWYNACFYGYCTLGGGQI